MRKVIAVTGVILMSACGAQTTQRPDAPFAAPFNADVHPSNDCWARLYERKLFQGRTLTIAGPARERELPPYWGFPWTSRYGSVAVGPAAALTVFEAPEFRAETATFKGGASVLDLDREMGVLRRIRSLKVTCVP